MFLIVTVMGQLPSNIWKLPVKPFTTIAVFVFALVALIQALRIVLGWDITVNGSSRFGGKCVSDRSHSNDAGLRPNKSLECTHGR
jgi:hypothetical protein